MASVTVKSVRNMTHIAYGNSHSVVVDEPPEIGDDTGMAPYELLLASLGS